MLWVASITPARREKHYSIQRSHIPVNSSLKNQNCSALITDIQTHIPPTNEPYNSRLELSLINLLKTFLYTGIYTCGWDHEHFHISIKVNYQTWLKYIKKSKDSNFFPFTTFSQETNIKFSPLVNKPTTQHSAQILDQKINHTIHKSPIFLSILIQNSKEQPDFLSDQTGKKKKPKMHLLPKSNFKYTLHEKIPTNFLHKKSKFSNTKKKTKIQKWIIKKKTKRHIL